VGQHATRQEVTELALDELREMCAACRAGSLREKRLQVLADDAVEDAALGCAGLVRGGRRRHVPAILRKAACGNAANVIRLLDGLRRSRRGRPSAARGVGERAFLSENLSRCLGNLRDVPSGE